MTILLFDCRGYNIGVRLIEDFLARTQQGRCYELRETADILAKVNAAQLVECGRGVIRCLSMVGVNIRKNPTYS